MTGTNIRLSKCSISQTEKDAVMRALNNEYFGMGKEVQAFESELKEYFGCEGEVICVNTGTSALHITLACLDIGPGDEVLVPSLTYVASYQAISATGATPVSCDVDLDSAFISIEDARKKITKKTKAIMPVHYASNSLQIDAVYKLAKEFNLRVIEDAAHSVGCERDGKRVGAIGDILCFSFDGIKNITSGEGGAVVTADQTLAQRIKDARLLGVEKDTEKRFSGERSWVFDVNHQGFRYHMSDIMAALGRAQLSRLDFLKQRRQEIALQYFEGLNMNSAIELFNFDYKNICSHIFVIKVKDGKRDALRDYLQDNNVATGVHYYPNHFLSKYKSEPLANVETLYGQILTLPIHPDLTSSDISRVIELINKFGL
ncbi:putative UDP-4-amino-4-deoxy-L-arabinose--oxoglutarate aminotransferase [Bacteriovorax sp. BSW11_IV]|uniref:DegT/DnrJ/EryC1/StrS family aminotransferase n=1 Tax=Bacteriovorax sp. BSW11_IV TaxID=1353529 RepID=UPI00038A4710|nr:DegT/DnrJ/EryC1/StrS family aminotransferase [Bacteriovorax sp. BSW11_IV]EQC45842.1 putative UDP-4-amino-4-deoxy-L-arabinose--oxoglutarate aminotransferase [Bacteriovorax sp. BSW11_IV]